MDTFAKYPIGIVLCAAISNVSMVTLITGRLRKINKIKLSQTWVSKAPRSVPD